MQKYAELYIFNHRIEITILALYLNLFTSKVEMSEYIAISIVSTLDNPVC